MMRSFLKSCALFLVLTAGMCPDKGPDFFGPSPNAPHTGVLTGTVFVGTSARPGAVVTLAGVEGRSSTTDGSGVFNFSDLEVGSYTIQTALSGFTCPPVPAVIVLDQTTTANVQCTVTPGSVNGTVRVSGTGQAGITVSLEQSGTTITSVQTVANGTYSMPNVSPGAYQVRVTPPTGVACGNSPQSINVSPAQATTANFDCAPTTGSVSGTVTVAGQVRSSVGVRVRDAQNALAGSRNTDIDGTYVIPGLPPGTYTVEIDPPPGSSCPANSQPVTISAGQNSVVNFICTNAPGVISGQVSGLPPGQNATLTLTAGSIDPVVVTTSITNANGSYSMNGIAPGTYRVSIAAPGTVTCTPGETTVTVVSNQTTTANFSCVPFIVNLAGNYRHIAAGSSEVCLAIVTLTPPQPGATWSVTWTGPGVVAPATRSGTLSQQATAFDRQAINLIGTYTATVTVTSGGVTVVKTEQVVVTEANGTCTPPAP